MACAAGRVRFVGVACATQSSAAVARIRNSQELQTRFGRGQTNGQTRTEPLQLTMLTPIGSCLLVWRGGVLDVWHLPGFRSNSSMACA